MPNTFLATQASRILEAALDTRVGLHVRVIAPRDIITPALRGRQLLYRFRQNAPAYETLRIEAMGDHDLWLIRT